MSRTLRMFVMGQSPRPDVEAHILLAAPDIRIRVEGVLDGMSRDQIAQHELPRSAADALFTTLSSGKTVTVAKAALVTQLLAKLEIGGPALLWSPTAFRKLPRRDDFVPPADLLTAMVDVLLPRNAGSHRSAAAAASNAGQGTIAAGRARRRKGACPTLRSRRDRCSGIPACCRKA
jgi:hypothetical protein